MDFVKKNWAAIALGAIALTGLIFALIQIINYLNIADDFEFGVLAYPLGVFLFFAGLLAASVCKLLSLEKNIIGFILIGTGVLAFIFILIGMLHIWNDNAGMGISLSDMVSGIRSTVGDAEANFLRRWFLNPFIYQMIVMGALPVVVGLKKVFCKCEGKS